MKDERKCFLPSSLLLRRPANSDVVRLMFHPRMMIVGILLMCVFAPSSAAQSSPRFEDYQVPVYTGAIHQPKWIRYHGSDGWRDNLGKLVEEPGVNFAGKYFVSAHSCGTSCRYYTMTDLSSGRELHVLEDFDSAEPSP